MALDALWAVLITEVSGVSKVQAPIHAGLRDTPAVLPAVSRVSSNDSGGTVTAMPGGADTPDTPAENARYQAQPARVLGCTPIPLIPLKKSMPIFKALTRQLLLIRRGQSDYSGSAGRG